MTAPRDILDTTEAGPRAIRGSALRVTGYGVGSGLSVLSAALLLRYLSVADFGRYATVLSLVTIVSGLTEAGMTSLAVREYATRADADRRAFLRVLLGLRIVLTLAGVAVAVAFALAAGYTAAMVWGTALWGLGVVVAIVAGTFAVPLQAELRLGLATGIELLRQVALVGGLVALVLVEAGLLPLLAVPLPAGVVVLLVTARIVRGKVPLRPRFARREAWGLLRETLPFAVASAVGTLYAYVGQVLMSLLAEPRETGLFGASFRIFVVLATVPGLLVSSVFPILARAARDDRTRLAYALQRTLEACLILGAGWALLTAIGAPVILDVVAGPGYADAEPVLRLHAVAMLGSFLVAVGGFGLLSLRLHRALLIANAIALATAGGLIAALAGPEGAEGAALANAVGELLLFALYLVALRRSGQPLELRLAPRVAIAAAIAAVPALLGLPALPAAVVAAVAYGATLLALRAVPGEILALVPRRR